MATLLWLTDRDDGRPILVNMDRALYVTVLRVPEGGAAISFSPEDWVRVAERLDEIAEKVRSIGGRASDV